MSDNFSLESHPSPDTQDIGHGHVKLFNCPPLTLLTKSLIFTGLINWIGLLNQAPLNHRNPARWRKKTIIFCNNLCNS